MTYFEEQFEPEEEKLLEQFVTDVRGPVYALINLPEVVKGALFARYSRSLKSVRRLLIDEFINDPDHAVQTIADHGHIATERAASLYERVFFDYGDDSVAQLGGVHLACEQASNVLTKVLEWGRLAAYLEQSTRYIFYDQKLGGRYRYHVPPEIAGGPHRDTYVEAMDDLFDTYSEMAALCVPYYEETFPRQEGDSNFVWRSTIKAKALDTVRGLLPASTTSHVGVYATGQAYEMALVRMQAHPLTEVREYGGLMLLELRKVIPDFLRRVDLEDRGRQWSRYLGEVAADLANLAEALDREPEARPMVTLVEWDPEAELRLAAAALYAHSDLPDDQLLQVVKEMSVAQRALIIAALVGPRSNRRHKPGRPAERSTYRFDVLSDYGAFRDLQRHRLLTIEWQRLSTRHGFDIPDELADLGLVPRFESAMDRSAELYETLRAKHGPDVGQYAVPFAYRIRYIMQMNIREAFHLLELRTQPAGHPSYRKVCQEMHRLIAEVAGHRSIAAAMRYVDHSNADLERLEEQRRSETKRARLSS